MPFLKNFQQVSNVKTSCKETPENVDRYRQTPEFATNVPLPYFMEEHVIRAVSANRPGLGRPLNDLGI